MLTLKKTIVAAVLTVAASASASASVVQSAGPVDYSSYGGWKNDLLAEVTFAQYTTHVNSLYGSGTAYDQGWGNTDPNSNQVYLGLFNNGTALWMTIFWVQTTLSDFKITPFHRDSLICLIQH